MLWTLGRLLPRFLYIRTLIILFSITYWFYIWYIKIWWSSLQIFFFYINRFINFLNLRFLNIIFNRPYINIFIWLYIIVFNRLFKFFNYWFFDCRFLFILNLYLLFLNYSSVFTLTSFFVFIQYKSIFVIFVKL
jgi:hypothetical protein